MKLLAADKRDRQTGSLVPRRQRYFPELRRLSSYLWYVMREGARLQDLVPPPYCPGPGDVSPAALEWPEAYQVDILGKVIFFALAPAVSIN